jgi:HEAT repeat protein
MFPLWLRAKRLVKQLRKHPEFELQLTDALIEAGEGSLPLYLAALDQCDPTEQGHLSSPYETLLRVLSTFRAVQMIPKVVRDYPRARRPESLAYAVAVLGHDQSIEPCTRWLSSDNVDVRRRVIEASAHAALGGHASPRYRQMMFAAIAKSLSDREDMPLARVTFEALLTLDQTAALRLLRTPDYLRLENPNLPDLLRAFSKSGTAVDPVTVGRFYRAAIAGVEGTEANTPERIGWEWVRDACLTILSDTAPESVVNELESALTADDKSLRNLAVELLIKIESLTPIYRNYTTADYLAWPREQQLVADLADMLLQIESNGLDAIWVNRDPLHYRTLVPHLREIGADRSAELLLAVAQVLGVDDPGLTDWPGDRALPFNDNVDEQIHKLSIATPEIDHIEVYLLRYMRRHRQTFQLPPDGMTQSA